MKLFPLPSLEPCPGQKPGSMCLFLFSSSVHPAAYDTVVADHLKLVIQKKVYQIVLRESSREFSYPLI